MALLKAHSWPGNIRELENVIEHAFVIEASTEITPSSLPESLTHSLDQKAHPTPILRIARPHERDPLEELQSAPLHSVSTNGPIAIPFGGGGQGFTLDINRLDFQANKEEFERQFLISALRAFKGRINQTALHANIPKKTLLRKLEKYAINARDYS